MELSAAESIPGQAGAGDLRAARWAVFANFLVMGFLWGAWAGQIPFAFDRLGTSASVFGLSLLSMAAGGIVAMPLASGLVNRVGSRAVTRAAGLATALLFLGPTNTPNLPLFLVAGALYGMGTGAWEIGMNSQGVAVERRLARPIMSSLHGGFSVGGIAGAFGGGYAILLFGAPGQAVLVSLAGCLCLGLVWQGFLPASVDKAHSARHFDWPTRASVVLGLLCLIAMMSEGALIDWSAIFLRDSFALGPAGAAAGYGLFSAGMTVSRLSGDAVRHRAGATRTLRASALMAAAGMALVLLAGQPLWAILALFLVGLGIGNFVPVLFASAGRDPVSPSRAIAATTALGYSGFLAGPPLIGAATDRVGLGSALWVIVIAALVIWLFAGRAEVADGT